MPCPYNLIIPYCGLVTLSRNKNPWRYMAKICGTGLQTGNWLLEGQDPCFSFGCWPYSPTGVGSHKSKGLSHYLADLNQRGLKIDLRILHSIARE